MNNLQIARVVGWLQCCGLSALLIACAPTYDWRMLRHPEYGYSALFPAQPVSASRQFEFAGAVRTLHLQSAKVDAALFTVAVVPQVEISQAAAVLQALQHVWVTNLQAQVEKQMTQPNGEQTLQAQGWLKQRATWLTLRSGYLRPTDKGQLGMVYAALVVGPTTQLTLADAENFLENFTP